MINSFYGLDTLGTGGAFLVALAVGFFFGLILEQAGFGSSRKLSGVFYFRDMTVIKVMFSALLTGMFGLQILLALGILKSDQLYWLPTIYGAQIVGGLIFGVGFVLGGWCPGTAAVGMAAGKLDALLFLGGAIIGSVLFNELFSLVHPLYEMGSVGVSFLYDAVGLSKGLFIVLFTAMAVGAFWICEWVDRRAMAASEPSARPLWQPALPVFSIILLALAVVVWLLPVSAGNTVTTTVSVASPSEVQLLAAMDQGQDHIEPEELADRLMRGEAGLKLVDLRTDMEYRRWHLPGALNVALEELPEALAPSKNTGLIVLYSNGMTHPAQARDALARLGYANVYLLTDGLDGFMRQVLKPASLRGEPVPPQRREQISAWRSFFLAASDERRQPSQAAATGTAAAAHDAQAPDAPLPGLAQTQWLADRLGQSGIKVIDLRPQPEYNSGHIPGALGLNVESLRGNVGGIPSMLLPAPMLAEHFSLMGLKPTDTVVLVYGDKPHDATLVAMAFERVGHTRYAILNGGFGLWKAEGRPTDTALPTVKSSRYPAPDPPSDDFTVDAQAVEQARQAGLTIIDVRPKDYFTGKKSDEARAGHIPGAKNRPFTEDVVTSGPVAQFKPVADLQAAYRGIIPDKDAPVYVHCRTGHQASQTVFVLRRLLGYKNVKWYDAGWTEWATRQELQVTTD